LVCELNKSQFPKNERTPIWLALRMAKTKKGVVDFLAFYDDVQFVGFVYLFTLNGLTSVMLLAVNSAIQSKGYGRQILEHVKSLYSDNRITINIEDFDERAKNIEQRKRRKAFYIKNGYESAGFNMKLFSNGFEVLISCGHSISVDEILAMYKTIFGAFVFYILKPFVRIGKTTI